MVNTLRSMGNTLVLGKVGIVKRGVGVRVG